MAKALTVTRVKAGEPDVALGFNVANFIEATVKCEGGSWLKYWDGKTVRTTVIKESPQQVIALCNK